MTKRMTLIEAYQKTPTNIGVMSDYNRWSDNVPYLPTNQVASIDNMYYLTHSGDKYISPYVKRVMSFDFPSEDGWRTLIGKDLYALYHDQLLKQWNLFADNYDPMNPYYIEEHVTYDHSGGGESTDSGTDSKKQKGQILQGGSVKVENYASTYQSDNKATGYSTTNYAPNNDNAYTQYGRDNNNPLQTDLTYGKKRTTTESANDDLMTTKRGNLGVVLTSQIMGTEIELWKQSFYLNIMFPLFDKVLTLPIY